MAVIDVPVRSATSVVKNNLLRDSEGNLYIVSVDDATNDFVCRYSTDAGQTWTEVTLVANVGVVASAISADDVIHITYENNDNSDYPWHVTFSSFTFGTPEAINTTYAMAGGGSRGITVAIDSTDTPHVAWGSSDNNYYYSKKTGGSWTASTTLDATGGTNEIDMAIDSNDDIHIVYIDSGTNDDVYYVKYDGSWSTPLQLQSLTDPSDPRIVVDSSDNLHVTYVETSGTDLIRYVKYTKGTGLWGSPATVTASPSSSFGTSLGCDISDNLYLVYSDGTDIYVIVNTGSWGAASLIIDGTAPNLFRLPHLYTPRYPVLSTVPTNIPTTGYHFFYENNNTLGSRYHASTDLTFPAPALRNYSRKASGSLPSDDTGLTNSFTSLEYANVGIDDAICTDQTATDQYTIQQFKNKSGNSTDEIHVTWIGKTNIAPSASTVYLQIYNRNSTTWETLDSDSATSAGTNLTLTGSKTTGLSNYYNGSNWVSCRVYQLAQ